MLNLKFAKTQNLVAFLEKPKESDGFEGIMDFLNVSSIRYALTVNPTIYTDAEGTECLPNATIFEQLTLLGAKTTAWNEFSSTMASAVICLATNKKFNFSMYIFDNMVKNLEGGVKFLMYPRSFDDRSTVEKRPVSTDEVTTPQKKQPRRKQRKDTEVPQPSGSIEPITDKAANKEHIPIHSNDPLLSGEDRLKLNELIELCTNLSKIVLDLENTKTSQAAEINKLKEKVKKLERRNKSRTLGLKRLRRGRKIVDFDVDAEVTLVDEAQGRNDDNLMFDTGVFDKQEVEVEKVVSTAKITTTNATTTVDELNLAQTLIEIKVAKPKAFTTAATTTTTAVIRPKARGVVVLEPSEFKTTTSPSQTSQLPQTKDKGKAKMIEPENHLKKKDQILIDEEIAQKHQRRNQMCTCLKNMAGFTHNYEVVKRGREKDECSVTRAEESSSKRASTELEQERIKMQKIDDDQEEAEMKKHMEIVVDEEEIAVDAIPLATKPPITVDWKIIKEGKMEYFQLIRADGSSRRYSLMIKMLQNIDREDLETCWKLVKAKHGNTRQEEAYKRVIWGDLKVMFELDVESEESILSWDQQANLDADAEVTLVDEAQGRNDDNLMFDRGVFYEQEVEVEKVVSIAEVTTASATKTVDELTMAQTLIEIKPAKPKAVKTAATTTTPAVTRPKARGVVVKEPSEFRTTTSSSQTSQLPQTKDKGKAKMVEPEKPLKKKDQILIDEEIAQKLQAQLNAELEEEEKLAKQKEEDANIAE
ncbi:hypothetical protein Tco_0779531 [Tanacetum coccineum]